MKATILRQFDLPDLPSASGVEVVGDTAYIIGDDSPFLYCFDARALKPNGRITLFETVHFSSGRLPKNLKPDLECLTAVPAAGGDTALLVCGSGATAEREKGFWVTLPKQAGAGAAVYPLSLSTLYTALRKALPKSVVLNLEAAAATTTELLLFQRTVGSGAGNLLFRLPLQQALDFIQHRSSQLPSIQTQFYQLPSIAKIPAGFSGATTHKGKLFVTASVEDTSDPVADGEVLGSFVGMLDLAQRSDRPLQTRFTQLIIPNGQPYRGKVESITVRREIAPQRYELLLVTDDDAGGSTAVLVELEA
ncbi:DUF6929 family protein [Hymenobacter radiodurans]|uniref:DUF6929 family protein n=1 Tax=Hymenobacter radiodurans TaxID=2496028 RepID=UPI0010587C45|nr:hypothetical protein [Hymenobacter radiodurans]